MGWSWRGICRSKGVEGQCGSGFGRIESFLGAFSSCIEANSASAEGQGEDSHEKIVREMWVIVCGCVDGGDAFVDLKEINARCGSGFRGILGKFGIDPGCIGVCGSSSFGVLTMDVIGPSDR